MQQILSGSDILPESKLSVSRSHPLARLISTISIVTGLTLSSIGAAGASDLLKGTGDAVSQNSGVVDASSHKGSTGPSYGSSEERWEYLKAELFGGREIETGAGLVRLEAAGRAFDAARVPVTIRASRIADSDYIQKLYLIVDNNPVPVAATFTFEPNKGWDTIDTELRVNEYSHMRVVAETGKGVLHMDKRFIKAVGGCSAPPSSYERSDKNLLGNFRGNVSQLLNPKLPTAARIRIVHPNASGMQFDQFTRTYIQPHYIHTMAAEFDGEPLFKVETNFSLSQDPVLGFNFKPESSGELKIIALDSKDQRFEQSWQLKASDVN